MNKRILAIDDEKEWQDNYRAWIQPDLADIHPVEHTRDAVTRLRRCYYHLVVLDLSMDLHDQSNRDNLPVQEYLASKPDGTRYVIVSGTATIDDVLAAGWGMNAFAVFLKQHIDPSTFSAKVCEALDVVGEAGRFGSDTKSKLIRDTVFENRMLGILNPGGAASLLKLVQTLSDQIAPVGIHKIRRMFDCSGKTVVALVWSRQFGHAVSVVLSNIDIPTADARAALAAWLGYQPESSAIEERVFFNKVRLQLFHDDAPDEHFELPHIVLPAS